MHDINSHNLPLARRAAYEYGGLVKIAVQFRLFQKSMGLGEGDTSLCMTTATNMEQGLETRAT